MRRTTFKPREKSNEEKGVEGMMRNMIRIGAFFSLLLLFPSYLSAGLNTFQFRIIKIAFMNGYVRALASEERTIKRLRENKQFMEKFVKSEAEKYMQEVSRINRKIPDQKILKASSEALRRNNNW